MNWLKPRSGLKQQPEALETTVTYLEMRELPRTHIQRPANINAALLNVQKHAAAFLPLSLF